MPKAAARVRADWVLGTAGALGLPRPRSGGHGGDDAVGGVGGVGEVSETASQTVRNVL